MGVFGILAGVAGIGGVGFFALKMFAPGILASITAVASKIPPKAWLAIGAAVLLVVGYFVHQHKAHAALDAAYASGRSDADKVWQKSFDTMHAVAVHWKHDAEANASNISREERARHENDLHAIASRADAERLRGPGKAAAPACVGHLDPARLPATPGGHGAAGGNADSGLAGLPPEGGLAIVPWRDLVSAGKLADANRAEVNRWREWYAREAEANRIARETGIRDQVAVPR